MKKSVEIRPDGVYLDDNKFFLLSGDFHYFRTVPGGWERRLKLMRDFGLTAVTTYVAWNVHEPERGKYCFEGIGNLPLFLELAQKSDLKVILRFSPYMCAEWEFGGFPWWLLKEKNICLRSTDPKYFSAVEEYTKVLVEKIRPYLHTNGGPVILVGLENEYGSFGDDNEYLVKLKDLYLSLGIDVPFVSANGVDDFKYYNGTLKENWNGIDHGIVPGNLAQLELLKKLQPDKPLMVSEAWTGGLMFWSKNFKINNGIGPGVEYFKQALELGAVINFYMFCGGTNFGFYNGALKVLNDRKYMPLMTSYDYDAPISEEGTPREKYFALRDVLDEFLGKPKRPHFYEDWTAQNISEISLTEYADLLSQSKDICAKSIYTLKPVCMEDLDQGYGFIKYTTHVKYTDPRTRYLKIEGLCDRALIYLNGKYIGTLLRERDGRVPFTVPVEGADITILVENLGRINYGYDIYDTKGIRNCVHVEIEQPDGRILYNFASNMGFATETLPLDNLDKVVYGKKEPKDGLPTFCKGKFKAEAGVDTFLDMEGWKKGVVWINGFNIGRYWAVGPQRTLYVPGEILKEDNIIEIFELENVKETRTVSAIDHSILCEMKISDNSLDGFELL